ncbi:MAG: SEC-C domain-containing protein [Bacteroidales bacterium]|nr:SEC-C domain-containing protein [Bacteroidales bacterium]
MTVEIRRNDKCPCGSGAKYKKCCMTKKVSCLIICLNTGKLCAQMDVVLIKYLGLIMLKR